MSDARWMACQGRAIAVLLAIFVAGVASGAVGMHIYEATLVVASSENPAVETEFAVDELTSDLDLSPEQTAQIQAVLDEHIMQEADLLMRVRKVQQDGRARILQILSPDQRERFHLLFNEEAE